MISVVIPVFNKEEHIEKCIRSAINQTFADIEIIVVNDGSTDRSVEIVEKIKDERIIVSNQENKGPASARNIGILKARGNLIALLDADDFWSPFFLSELCAATIQYPEAILFASKYALYFPRMGKEYISPVFKRNLGQGGIIKDFSNNPSIFYNFSSSSILFKKAPAIKCGLQNELIHAGEDLDFLLRLSKEGQFFFYDKILAYCTQGKRNGVKRPLCPLERNCVYIWLTTGTFVSNSQISPIGYYCVALALKPYYFRKSYKSTLLQLISKSGFRGVLKGDRVFDRLPYTLQRLIYNLLVRLKHLYWDIFYY